MNMNVIEFVLSNGFSTDREMLGSPGHVSMVPSRVHTSSDSDESPSPPSRDNPFPLYESTVIVSSPAPPLILASPPKSMYLTCMLE